MWQGGASLLHHIVFNSTALDCARKFDEPLRPDRIIRRISDQICAENGLSVIKNPKPSRGHYGTWLGDTKQPSKREKLETLIDNVLAQKPADYDAFIKLLEAAGCEVKRGKSISVKAEGQKRFIRLRTLGEDYSEDAIRERIEGKRIIAPNKPKAQTHQPTQERKVSLLIDIQNSIKAQNSPGYERWAKIFNLKSAASTLIFLQENDLDTIEKLDEKAQRTKDDFNGISARIQAIDARLKDISTLQKHIGTYSKTREIYAAYRKAGYSKKFLAEHSADIAAHKAAKQYFDALKLEKLPAIKTLQAEYATLSPEKKMLYSGYQQVRKDMQEILAAQQNAKSLLNYHDKAAPTKTERT